MFQFQLLDPISLTQNVLDDRLKHANSGVVLGTISLFLHLTDDLPDLQQDVYTRIHSETSTHAPINLQLLVNYVCTDCFNSFVEVLQ